LRDRETTNLLLLQITDYENVTKTNVLQMLDWLIRFVWPIIGAVALLLLLLWICHVVKNNAVTRFFNGDQNMEMQSTSRNMDNCTTINIPMDSSDDSNTDIVRTSSRRSRRVRTATGLRPKRIREVVFMSLVAIVDNGIIPRYPIWCNCPTINENTAFKINGICEPMVIANAEKSPIQCSCWDNNGWYCSDAEIVVSRESVKNCQRYEAVFTTEPLALYTTLIESKTVGMEKDSMMDVIFIITTAIVIVIAIVVVGKMKANIVKSIFHKN